ncbi:SH3 domain-containing protein [Spirillospora sp. NPDC049024]
MHVRMKLGVAAAATALTGGALGLGATASAAPPPVPGQNGSHAAHPSPSQPQEEGHGPGAIEVGPQGAAEAMNRLLARDGGRSHWCYGEVLPENGLNVRTGPSLDYPVVGVLARDSKVKTDWDTIERRDGYLWVMLTPHRWIADYKLGPDNGDTVGKWYVKYFNC